MSSQTPRQNVEIEKFLALKEVDFIEWVGFQQVAVEFGETYSRQKELVSKDLRFHLLYLLPHLLQLSAFIDLLLRTWLLLRYFLLCPTHVSTHTHTHAHILNSPTS